MTTATTTTTTTNLTRTVFAFLSVTMFGEMEIDEPWLLHTLTLVVFLLCASLSNETSWFLVFMGNVRQIETASGCVYVLNLYRLVCFLVLGKVRLGDCSGWWDVIIFSDREKSNLFVVPKCLLFATEVLHSMNLGT